MEYTASHKNSFKWSVKDDILHYDTPQILALIQQPAPICNCFFRIKNTSLKNFHCNVNQEIKIPSTVLNKNFLQYNFSKDEMFEEEKLLSKNTAKCMDFTIPKPTSSRFFLSIKLCIKRILTTTDYCILQQNIM